MNLKITIQYKKNKIDATNGIITFLKILKDQVKTNIRPLVKLVYDKKLKISEFFISLKFGIKDSLNLTKDALVEKNKIEVFFTPVNKFLLKIATRSTVFNSVKMSLRKLTKKEKITPHPLTCIFVNMLVLLKSV